MGRSFPGVFQVEYTASSQAPPPGRVEHGIQVKLGEVRGARTGELNAKWSQAVSSYYSARVCK